MRKLAARNLFIGLAAVAGGTNQPERAAKLSGAAQAYLILLTICFLRLIVLNWIGIFKLPAISLAVKDLNYCKELARQ